MDEININSEERRIDDYNYIRDFLLKVLKSKQESCSIEAGDSNA